MLGKTVRVPRHVELSEPGWRRNWPASHVECFAKACETILEVGTGRYRVKRTIRSGNLYSHVPQLHITLGTDKKATFSFREASCCFLFLLFPVHSSTYRWRSVEHDPARRAAPHAASRRMGQAFQSRSRTGGRLDGRTSQCQEWLERRVL